MMAKSYFEKLRDPRWQKRRLEVMQNDSFSCRICGAQDMPLNVHHRGYIKGMDPWDYDDDQLVTLCEDCHEDQHEDNKVLQEVLSRLPIKSERYTSARDLAFLIAGLLQIDIKAESDDDMFMSSMGAYVDSKIIGRMFP